MSEWFSSISAFTGFLSIAVIGFLFLLVSLIFGEIFDFFHFDTDFDHGGPSFFSTRVLSVFITAFGGVGAIGVRYGLSTGMASFAGFGSGLALGSLIYVFARFLYSQQASSDMSVRDLVGHTGRVIIGIPAGGVGQVRLQIGETLVDKIARSHDGQPIPENAVARVDEILGETIVVRRQ